MVRHTDEADDESTETIEATIYHTRFTDEDDDAFELTRDIRMGHEWAVDHDIDLSDTDVVEAAYVEAGTVTVEVTPSYAPEAAAYSAWEDGEGHDTGSTRSMATGDVIVIDGVGDDHAHFVDSIGFEEINAVPFDRVFGGHAEDGDDEDDDTDGVDVSDVEEGDTVRIEGKQYDGEPGSVTGDVVRVTDVVVRISTENTGWYYQPASGEAYADDRTRADGVGVLRVEAVEVVGDDEDPDADTQPDAFGSDDDFAISDAEVAAAFGVDDVEDITDEMLADVETRDPPETVDVSDYKTAAGAAKKTHEAITEWAEFMHDAGDAVVLYDPDETRAKRDVGDDVDAWCVAWEGGPNEWATALTGGESITAFAGHRVSYGTTPEVAGLTSGEGFDVECFYSFDILFFNR